MPLRNSPKDLARLCLNSELSEIRLIIAEANASDLKNEYLLALLKEVSESDNTRQRSNGYRALYAMVEKLVKNPPYKIDNEIITNIFSIDSGSISMNLKLLLLKNFPKIRSQLNDEDIISNFSEFTARACINYEDIRDNLKTSSIVKILLKHYDKKFINYEIVYGKRKRHEYAISQNHEKDIRLLVNRCNEKQINQIIRSSKNAEFVKIMLQIDGVADKLDAGSIKSIWTNKLHYNGNQQEKVIQEFLFRKKSDALFKFNIMDMVEILVNTDVLNYLELLESDNFELLAMADGDKYLQGMEKLKKSFSSRDRGVIQSRINEVRKTVSELKKSVGNGAQIKEELDVLLETQQELPIENVSQKIKILITNLDDQSYNKLKWNATDNQKIKENFISNVINIVEKYSDLLTENELKSSWRAASNTKVAGYHRLGANANSAPWVTKSSSPRDKVFFEKLANDHLDQSIKYHDKSYEELSKINLDEQSLDSAQTVKY